MAKRIDMWESTDGKIHATEHDANAQDHEMRYREIFADLLNGTSAIITYGRSDIEVDGLMDFIRECKETIKNYLHVPGEK